MICGQQLRIDVNYRITMRDKFFNRVTNQMKVVGITYTQSNFTECGAAARWYSTSALSVSRNRR